MKASVLLNGEMDSEILEDFLSQAKFLYSTVEGTCPGNRGFGITPIPIDAPSPIAENILTLDIIEKTEEYLPMLNVDNISFDYTDEGISPVIQLSINEEYFEEDDEDE